MRRAFGARVRLAALLSNRTTPRRPLCTTTTNNNKPTTATGSGGGGVEKSGGGSLSANYEEAYRQLDKLDFMTAAKILFTTPPVKKKKFGLDFHLVQLFFACLPSFAVYLVAQYSRYEMRRMEAELEVKKKAEEEAKAKEAEQKAAEEKAEDSNPELSEVKERLGKLEEAVKEIVVETKKQLDKNATKTPEDASEKKDDAATDKGNTEIRSKASNSEAHSNQKSKG